MLHHTYFIRQIAKIWKGSVKCYLEIGINEGYNFGIMSKVVPDCYGVEINTKMKDRLKKFKNIFWCSSDDFFKYHKNEIPTPQMIFIDGDHHFEQVKKDLENSVELIQDDGMIFIHDTDAVTESIREIFQMHDCHKIIDYVHEHRQDLDILTLPMWGAGLSLIRKRSARRVLEWQN